jgi:hypothetical protein
VVYFGSVKVDHFSEGGLLFSVVAQEEMGIDYTAKNNSSLEKKVGQPRIYQISAHGLELAQIL